MLHKHLGTDYKNKEFKDEQSYIVNFHVNHCSLRETCFYHSNTVTPIQLLFSYRFMSLKTDHKKYSLFQNIGLSSSQKQQF